MMTYLCPKCQNIMICVSTASIPPIVSYQCMQCGYKSKNEKEHADFQTLPQWLWSEEDK